LRSAARILKGWKRGQGQIELLEMLATKTRPRVAEELEITQEALTQRIATIREDYIKYEWWVKEVAQLKRISPYIVGLLAPTHPDELYRED